MSGHHHLPWALLNSSSDIDDDDINNNNNDNDDKSTINAHLLPPPPPQVGKKREAADGKPGGGAESSDHEIHIWTERERRKKMRNMFSNLHALLPHLPAKADKSTIVDEAVNYIKNLQQTLQKLHKQKLQMLQNNNNNPKAQHYHPSQSSTTTTREAFLADQAAAATSSSTDISSAAALLTHHHLSTTVTATATTANLINNILPPPSPAATAFHTWTSSNLVLSVCGGDAHFSVCSAKKPGLFAAVCYVLDKHQIEVVSAHVSSDFHRSFFIIQAHANGLGCDEFGAAMVAEEIFKQAAGEIMFWLSS